MLAEILEPIQTKAGLLRPGQIVSLPDSIAGKLGGKIKAHLPQGITFAEIETEFSADPEWKNAKNNPLWIHHLAETIRNRRMMERGEAPPHFTARRVCPQCGPVMLDSWTPEEIAGCPWCLTQKRRQEDVS